MSNGTPEADARATYEDAKAALETIIDESDDQAVADEAEKRLHELAIAFAAAAWDRIEKRTANLATLAEKLEAVITAAGENPAPEVLDRVTGVTKDLAAVLARVRTLAGIDGPGAGASDGG